MDLNLKLAKVVAVAVIVLVVFVGLYAWHGLSYLVRSVVDPHQSPPRRRPRTVPGRHLKSVGKSTVKPEKAAA